MPFGNPGNFGGWSRQKQFTYAKMYEHAHARRGNPRPGCLSAFAFAAGILLLLRLLAR